VVGLSQLRLAEVLTAQRRWLAAESMAQKGLKVITANQPPNPADTRKAHEVLARLYEALARRGEAEREWSLARQAQQPSP
jgi:hypothetical protein